MIRTLASLLLLAVGAFSASADYSLKNLKGSVQISRNGKVVNAANGMTVDANDVVLIGAGGSLDVFDSSDSSIYSATSPGQFTITRIIFDARKAARSNTRSVHGKLRMTKSKDAEGVVYVEKGKVTRSLAMYDPEAQNLRVDTDKLSRRLYTLLRDSLGVEMPQTGALVLNRRIEPDGLAFMVENTMEYPVYFNVFKLNATTGSITISELGQPVGCYAILPTQFLAREQSAGINPDELHVLIMTDYYFDIDELLAKLNELIDAKDDVAPEPASISLYLLPL